MSIAEAREARERQLHEILERLDRLETDPIPPKMPEAMQQIIVGLGSDWQKTSKQITDLLEDVDALAQAHKDIVIAVAEGIERVDRSERRIQGTIKRAQKKLADHGFVDEGLDAEVDQLQLIDGDRGKEPGVQPVRDEVASVKETPSSIEGVTLEQLRKARGL